MRRLRETMALAVHVVRLWRAGQFRFRLETFGVYYPSLPNQAPWWRVNPTTIRLLLAQMSTYVAWLSELQRIKGHCTESRKELDFLLTGADES